MKTIDDIIKENSLDFQRERVPHNPTLHTSDSNWARTASHWYCTLVNRSHKVPAARMYLTTYYSMGSAHKSGPDLRSVLGCLASDAAGADQPFESWAADLGFDTDSRKAYALWERLQRHHEELKAFMGPAYSELIQAERL
jgi:hypothetical protein